MKSHRLQPSQVNPEDQKIKKSRSRSKATDGNGFQSKPIKRNIIYEPPKKLEPRATAEKKIEQKNIYNEALIYKNPNKQKPKPRFVNKIKLPSIEKEFQISKPKKSDQKSTPKKIKQYIIRKGFQIQQNKKTNKKKGKQTSKELSQRSLSLNYNGLLDKTLKIQSQLETNQIEVKQIPILSYEELAQKLKNQLLYDPVLKNIIPAKPIISALQKYSELYYTQAQSNLFFKDVIDYLEKTTNEENLNIQQQTLEYTQIFAQNSHKQEQQAYFRQVNTLKLWESIRNAEIDYKNQNQANIRRDNLIDMWGKNRISPQQDKKPSKLFHELDFEMNFEEITSLASRLRDLCQLNIHAFMFLSNYLVASIQKMHAKGQDLEVLEKKIIKILRDLQKIYPPVEPIEQSDLTNKIQPRIPKIPQDKLLKIDLSIYQPHDKVLKLQEFIMERAKAAKQNLNKFIKLTKGHCKKKGLHYATGIKIQSANHRSAIQRVKEKILRKTQDFKKKFKKYTVEEWKKGDQFKKDSSLESYLKIAEINCQKQITSIYNQIATPFDFQVTDLLRGKCMFYELTDLNEAAQKIIEQAQKQGYFIVEVQNRLGCKKINLPNNKIAQLTNESNEEQSKMTSVLVLKILIGETVAQLQLVMEFSQIQNKFSHKIYEIYRSQFFGELKMLNFFNKEFSLSYLSEVDLLVESIEKKMNNRLEIQNDKENLTNIKQYIYQHKKRFFLLKQTKNNENADETAQNNSLKIKQILKNQKQISLNKQNKDQIQQICLIHEAHYYLTRKQNQKGIQLYSLALIVENFHQNKEDKQGFLNRAKLLQRIGTMMMMQGRYNEALNFFSICTSIYQMFGEKQSLKNAQNIFHIGNNYLQQGKYHEAIQKYLQCYQIYYKINKNANISKFCQIFNCMGLTYDRQGNYDYALRNYNQSLRLSKTFLGKESPHYSAVLHNIGLVYQKKKQYHEALKSYNQCLEIQQEFYGKESIQCSTTLGNLGILYEKQGNYSQALKILNRSLAIKQKIKGKDHFECSFILNSLGSVYSQLQKYDEALMFYHQCLKIKQKVSGKDGIDCVKAIYNIGYVYFQQKKYDEALKYYYRCLQIESNFKGENSIDCALTLNGIGNAYKNKGNFDEALQNLKKSLEIRINIQGKDSVGCAETLNDIGVVFDRQGNFEKALQYYYSCLAIQAKELGTDNVDYAKTLVNIGLLEYKHFNLMKGFLILSTSYSIFFKFYGQDHHLTVKVKGMLEQIKGKHFFSFKGNKQKQ